MSSNSGADYDVLVVGGGGAGLSAAITACDAGARVAVLEAGSRLGGSTALAGGYLYAAGTRQQREQNVDDSIEAMVSDIRRIEGDTIPEPVLRRFAEGCADAVAWLEDQGVEFPVERLVSADGRMPARSHEPVGSGAAIIERLDYQVSRRPIDVVLDTRVTTLVRDAQGAVCGIELGGETITAGAVVLACGGIGGDAELLDRMCPKSTRGGDWRWFVGCETNRGDGLRMCEALGADITGEDSGLFLMTPGFYRDFEVIGPPWVLLVNTQGRRIAREDGAYWELSEALEAQEDGRGFCVFDHAQMQAAVPDPRVLEALEQGAITLSWIPRVLQEQIDLGKVIQADSVAALADKMGVSSAALAQTVARYNQSAAEGVDEEFGKQPANLTPIASGPFYAVEVRPAIAVVLGAGPAIDGRARVLDREGQPIPGLFAAGEAAGNSYGRYYVGSGYAIASAITFGRAAGGEAATHAASQT